MPNVTLTPDLAAFAEACVASGRYAHAGEVVASAMVLLQDQEARLRALHASLDTAERDAEAGNVFDLDEIMAEMDAIIAEEEARRAAEPAR